jgi:hypothetical protein
MTPEKIPHTSLSQQEAAAAAAMRLDSLTSANDPGFSSRFEDYDMPSSVEDMNGIDDDDGSDRDDFVDGGDFAGTNFEDLRGDPERPKEADSDSLRVIPSGPSSCNTVSDESELSGLPHQKRATPGPHQQSFAHSASVIQQRAMTPVPVASPSPHSHKNHGEFFLFAFITDNF